MLQITTYLFISLTYYGKKTQIYKAKIGFFFEAVCFNLMEELEEFTASSKNLF